MEHRILMIIEDIEFQNKITGWLKESTKIYCTSSIQVALSHLTIFSYHLIIIAVNKTKEMICQIIRTIRKINVIPIIIITYDKSNNRDVYIKEGADSVLTDSDNRDKVMLHVYALIRRYVLWGAKQINEEDIQQLGLLLLNRTFRRAYWKNQELFLTKREFDFLYLLASTPHRVYTFEQIYDIVWKEHCHGDINNIIWCLVRRIRKKLNRIEPRAGDIIKNARNIGYSFEPIEDKNT